MGKNAYTNLPVPLPWEGEIECNWIARAPGGDFWCRPCAQWATPEHLQSQKHLHRRKNDWMKDSSASWWTDVPADDNDDNNDDSDRPVDVEGVQPWELQRRRKPWKEDKLELYMFDAGDENFYCKLCAKWVGDKHLKSKDHLKALDQRYDQQPKYWHLPPPPALDQDPEDEEIFKGVDDKKTSKDAGKSEGADDKQTSKNVGKKRAMALPPALPPSTPRKLFGSMWACLMAVFVTCEVLPRLPC